MNDDQELFGVPSANIEAAKKWANLHRKRYEYHTKVPTRKEVLSLPVEILAPLLVGWMEHSPIEIVPSRIQIEQVVELLNTRPDSASLERLLTMCQHYIRNQ
ncbi:hypothetical protein GTP46_11225 [Duganella sp. FT135W]|uniref:Uncharacterized protein n=1 Tax=Duganella flavida TaxID=2692175 RepID=A0A6L8K9C1_9BURK|nr:hypothetical protein [Duganella flavida]MYM23217.1 hypothetical protein [Duganella flavida]